MNAADEDKRFMMAAVRLARRHLGLTGSNPSVGAIIVESRGGSSKIVGEGVTATGGRPHAETQALLQAGQRALGATAYVTLEPCSHHGQTPPCCEALVRAGIRRIVIGIEDPDQRVSGRGIAYLKNAGVLVTIGVAKDAVNAQLAGYLMRKTQGRPRITLKFALAKDGAIGVVGQGKLAISGSLSHQRSHILRAESDAILVGVGTVLADDPLLTCRLPGLEQRSPKRIILDRYLRLDMQGRMVATAHQNPVQIFCLNNNDAQKKQILVERGCDIIEIEETTPFSFIEQVVAYSGQEGISELLIEGGAAIADAFIKADLVDRLVLFQSKTELQGQKIYAPSLESMTKNMHLSETAVYGDDIYSEWMRD